MLVICAGHDLPDLHEQVKCTRKGSISPEGSQSGLRKSPIMSLVHLNRVFVKKKGGQNSYGQLKWSKKQPQFFGFNTPIFAHHAHNWGQYFTTLFRTAFD